MKSEESVQKLLGLDEGVHVEFKVKIDLDSKEGKAHFLKEILALANSAISEHPSFLVIGVEDKTKKVIGIDELSEETLQQIVESHCKPPVPIAFNVVTYQGKDIGVVKIFCSSRKPHTFISKYGYQDSSSGKSKEIRENQVFVRRGSTISQATVDEIIALAQENDSEGEQRARLIAQIEYMSSELREISNNFYDFSRNGFTIAPNRYIEGTFVAIVTGALFGLFLSPIWMAYSVLLPLIGIVISVVLSALKIIEYGLIRSIISGSFFGAMIALLFSLALNNGFLQNIIMSSSAMSLFSGSIIGVMSGIIISNMLANFERWTR